MGKRILVCSVIALVFALGCTNDPGLKNKANAFKVNGTWVTKAEVDQVAGQLHQQLAAMQPDKGMFGDVANMRKGAARQVVANQLLVEAAKKRGMIFNDSAVNKAFEEFKKQVGPERFVAGLAASGKTQEDFKKELPQAMAVDSLVKIILARVDSATPEMAKKYYEENPDKFSAPGRIRARQIMILVKQDAKETEKAAARKKAEDALAQIKGGKDFVAVSRLVSQDPNAKDGGDIGWFKRGDFSLKELEDAAFSLKKKEISPVVASQLGFHIVQKTDEEAARTMPFDEVKDRLRMMLEVQNRTQAIQNYVDTLITQAKIVYADTSYRPDTAGGLSAFAPNK